MGTEALTAIIEMVDASRVVSLAQLHAHLASDGSALSESDIRQIVVESEPLELVDDLVFSRASLIAGRTYTARATSPDRVESHYDLVPFFGAQQQLEQVAGVGIGSDDRQVLVVGAIPNSLEPGCRYLAVAGPGDLQTSEFGAIAPDRFDVESTGSGRLAAGEIEVAAIRTASDRLLAAGTGVSARALVAYAISLNWHCFREPTLPLSDLFTAAGLEDHDGEWGRNDKGWTPVGEAVTDKVINRLIDEHGLSDDQAGDFRLAVLQWQQWVGGRSTVNATSFTALLTGRVAVAFAEYWQPVGVASIEEWMDQRRLVETLARKHGDHPGVNYLRGMIDLRLGDGAAAFDFFQRAHDADEDFLPVRRELGLLLLDASRIDDAMDVLPADVPAFGAVEYLLDRAARNRAGADRGDPCRCGSGKKYRSCCARHLRLSEADQLDLIDIRLSVYLSEPPWSVQMDRLADIVSTEWGLMSFPEALADPFVQDVLAIEAGGAASYLAARGKLLTEPDTDILSTFTPTSRDAFDIDASESDRWHLRHPDSGAVLEIDALDRHPSPGDAVLVRTIRRDDHLSPVGPTLLIPDSHVSLLRVMLGSRPTAEQLLGWVCRRTEILRPSVDLTAQIDLRERGDEIGDPVLAGFDLDDLARRAMDG
ncbi:MAG: hypothetical protein KJN63_10625 [Acidimicrobiia bacterium]|nr:hypothetical protein [Acidimicrobiia bacterium]